MTFFLGLDLGQTSDPTAIAILERQHAPKPASVVAAAATEDATWTMPPTGVPSTHWPLANRREVDASHLFHCRHLERLALGTPYPTVAEHVGKLLASPTLRGKTKLVVDATGVGRPVVDMLSARGLEPIAITITGGDTVTCDGGGFRVPKRDLVGVVQVLLQTERLKFASEIPAVPMLVQDLLAFRVKIDPLTAHDSYGAWREGAHDDLVLAVSVATWYAQRPEAPRRTLPGSRAYSIGW